MKTESDKTQLTLNDPVDQAILKRLEQLNQAKQQIAEQLLELETEKVRILIAARPIEQEKTSIFEKILRDRGLPQDFAIEVDGITGQLKGLSPEKK